MSGEVRDSISSDPSEDNSEIEEMLAKLEEIKNGGPLSNPKDRQTPCRGNISSECMQRGLENLSEAQQETGTKAAIYGGIGTQLRGLAVEGDLLRIMEWFGVRETEDIDVLVYRGEENELRQVVEKLEDGGEAEIHVKSNYIPGSDELVEEAERIDFGNYHQDLDFELDVMKGTHLLYSKVFSSLGNKEGTRYDIGVMTENPDLFDVDPGELEELIHQYAEDPDEARDVLETYGMEL